MDKLNSNYSRFLFNLMVVLWLSACVNTRQVDVPTQTPVEVEDRVVIDGTVLPFPDEPHIQAESLPGQQQVSPVVQGLLAAAEQQRDAGDPEAAANSLERALRIEPRNAMLWSRLADIRFAQSNFQQAIQLAAKSNTLSGSSYQLRRQNWYLMANAYAATGDQVAAKKYRDKLK